MFQAFRNTQAARGRAALTWRGSQAALAHASRRDSARPRLQTALIPIDDGRAGVAKLAGVELAGEALTRLPLSGVLSEGSYQLLLEELPNAPREEMRSALSFRIRDRIDVPLDESVIELLEMPPLARAKDKPFAYAIVTRQDDVQSRIDDARNAGLRLDTIDLPELCMRNIAVRLPQDKDGVAFLHFTDEIGLLTITRDGVLYLIRHIDIGGLQLDRTPDTQVRAALIPQICLELQRSLDYYETHFDLPSISELVLGPGSGLDALKLALNEQLGLRVSTLDLADLFDLDEPLDTDSQRELLFAAGATLRPDARSGWES